MQKGKNYIIFIFFTIFFIACSEENPSIGISETSSSSDVEESSSSKNISSSSDNVYSSCTESSSSSWPQYSYGELLDERDGQVYKTIKIGNQTWMAENLNFNYHNPFAPTPALAAPSFCYNDIPDNCSKYGRLYRWSIAMDSATIYSNSGKGCGVWKESNEGPCKNELYNYTRGTCPENWHIPTESDVESLVNFAKASPESTPWIILYWFYGGKNDEFSQKDIDSIFHYFGTSIEIDSSTATLLFTTNSAINTVGGKKRDAFFIRCVKDAFPLLNIEYGEMTDERDGQVYKTIKIGNQTWMAENLNYAYLQPIEGFPDSSSFCYNNEPDSCAKYGRLYPWGAAIDSIGLYNEYGGYDQCGDPDEFNNVSLSGVCPPNWHIPSVDEWRSFIDIISKNSLELKIYDINHQIGKKTCFWTPLQYSNIPENLYCGGYFYAYRFCFSSSDREVSFDNDRKTKTFPVRCAKGPPTYVE